MADPRTGDAGDQTDADQTDADQTDADPVLAGPWIDQHCHLGVGARGGDPADLDQVLAEARRSGVVAMVDVGTDAASSRACLGRAAVTPGVWATAGVHPHDATEGTAELRRVIDEALSGDSLVAIGECGLDYHYDHSPRPVQRAVFAEQVALAHELDLPLVIHTRDAWDDTFEVLDELGTPPRTVFHCFTGGPADAAACRERGAWLSISGIVTFPSAEELRVAVAQTPLDRLMVETDSPYLAPVPHRGQANQPARVGLVGAAIAAVHGTDVATVAAVTTATASAFYGIDPG
jgi:TatD DNase family protein